MQASIVDWLNQIGLGKYSETFDANDIDRRALPHLTEDDLRELGVSLGHRKVLMSAIEDLGQAVIEPERDQVTGDNSLLISPAPAVISVNPAEAERRLLSILFCDLVGSTSLSEQLDAEELREILRRYQDAVAGCITRYGGHVAKYLGDGVIAYFGWPRAYEDQAERAVRAALEALEAVRDLTSGIGVQLNARVGIATGEVIVGDLIGDQSKDTDAVAGDTPNLAARLQALAEPDTLLIAGATQRLVGSGFELEPLGKRSLKGFKRQLDVFRVLRERRVDSRFEAAHGDAILPFVGRVHEIGLLAERWKSAQQGRGQVILVNGEPGIGKSRLIEAFCTSLGDGDHQIMRMQCSPYLSDSAYHPFIERITRAAGFAPTDNAETRLGKLEKLLAADEEDLNVFIPVYAELLSINLDSNYRPLELQPQALKELTLRTLVERFGSIAARLPTVLVLEDAHWIDPSTKETIERLLPRIQSMPALLIVTHRTEWTVDWAEGYPHCSMISINRIGREQVNELVEAVIGTPPTPALIDEIMRRTDGVPLFVVELARTILETSTMDEPPSQVIPATLQGSLMARLDRLPSDLKSVAQMASVIGRDFDVRLLAKVVGLDEFAMQQAVDHLQKSQIIMRSAVSSDAFAFRHALIQDTAYQSLLTSRRRSYHDIIAEILAADYPEVAESQPELVARHFTHADRAEDALPLWRRAAERALARSSNFEAVRHSENARSAVRELRDPELQQRELFETELLCARALSSSGSLGTAMEAFIKAGEIAQTLDNPVGIADAALGYDNALFLANERDRSIIDVLKGAFNALGQEHERYRCQLLGRLARAHLLQGEYDPANKYNAEALTIAKQIGDEQAVFDVLVNDILMMPTVGRTPFESEQRSRDVEAILASAERLDENDALGRALSVDMYFSAEIGDRQRFDSALTKLSVLSEERQMQHTLWIARHGQAMQAVLDGRFVDAERLSEEALNIGRQTHGAGVEGVYGIQMFTIRREQGRLSLVAPIVKRLADENPSDLTWKPGFALIACDLGFLDPARRIIEELADAGFNLALDAQRSTTIAYLAEVCSVLRDERYAEAIFQLLKPYQHMTITTGVATICYGAAGRYLGSLASVLGDWDEAQQQFERAIELDTKFDAPPWLAHTQYAYADMLLKRGRSGDMDEAHALLRKALAAATALDMVSLKGKIQQLRN